jgi:hypothetical protein
LVCGFNHAPPAHARETLWLALACNILIFGTGGPSHPHPTPAFSICIKGSI